MRIAFHFFQLILVFILFSSCGDVLSDYDTGSINPLDIDNEICAILNKRQTVSAHIFLNNDSLTNENLFNLHSLDSNLFISISNNHSWNILIDSTSYFMLFASQQADSHFIALNSSSEFELYDGIGNLIIPDNSKISMQNIAGCSNARTRQAYSGLYGLYLARLYNPNVSNIELAFVNNNETSFADFTINNRNLIEIKLNTDQFFYEESCSLSTLPASPKELSPDTQKIDLRIINLVKYQ